MSNEVTNTELLEVIVKGFNELEQRLGDKIDRNSEKIDENALKIDNNARKIDGINNRLDADADRNGDRLHDLDLRVTNIEEKVFETV